jgi:glycosyltransferase involved in cell wall biosynthesis
MYAAVESAVPQIFVAWMPFQRRQLSMSPLLGFENVFLPISNAPRIFRPLQYVGHSLRTVALLRRKRPQIIWVQLPQVPLLVAALFYKRYFDPRVRIIADCHNRILNRPWNRWPGLRNQLNACDVVVVHNDFVVPKVEAMGIRRDIVRVLEDPPAQMGDAVRIADLFPHPWVLFLASFNPDEPIAELYEAARLAPEINFVLAGEPKRARRRHELGARPPNIHLPGYLRGKALDTAIMSTDAILALTKLPDAQLSSAGEAIGAGRPMVLSDTPVTRNLYYRGGVFVDTYSAASIAKGCRAVIEGSTRLAAESLALRDERYAHWRSQAQSINKMLAL